MEKSKLTIGEIGLIMNSPFGKDLNRDLDVNGSNLGMGMYNLIVTKSQLKLYVKTGMIPYRGWKIKLLNQYFGIKGNASVLLDKLEELYEFMTIKSE